MQIYKILKKISKNFIIKFFKINYFKIFLINLKNFFNKINKINIKIYYLYNNYIFKINILYFIKKLIFFFLVYSQICLLNNLRDNLKNLVFIFNNLLFIFIFKIIKFKKIIIF